jgi:biotin transport system substrate-specific component
VAGTVEEPMSTAIPSLTRVPATEKGITIADFLVPVRIGERVSPRLRDAALVVAGAILIFLTAKVSVPIPGNPVPFTLQNFGVLVVGGALGFRRGGAAAMLYVALGVIGLPFFAEGKGGISVIWGTTGGYLIGFIVAAALVGRLAELGWDRKIGGALGATTLGTAVIYAIGVPWLAVVTGQPLTWAIENGLLPFLALDIVKLVAAAAVFPAAWWVVGRRPSDR